MDRIRFFLKIFGFTFLVAGVGLLIFSSKDKAAKFIPSVKAPSVKIPLADVKGISTKKAASVSGAIASDVGDGVNTVKKQVLNLKISDIINVVSRAQKIPQDAHNVGDYVREQVDNVLKSKK